MAGMTTANKGAQPTPTKAKRKTHDWERIELDYRAGVKSLREIGADHSISEGAVRKRAKRDGWTRDLAKKIQSKADELVRKSEVRTEVRTSTAESERETIEANASAVAKVKIAHRGDIRRSRSITMSLLEELEKQTGAEQVTLLEELGVLMRDEDERGIDKLNDLYHKVISLPQRAKTMKDLGESLRVLIGLERQAYGMDDKDTAPVDGLTTLLNSITASSNNAFEPVVNDPELPPAQSGSALPMSSGSHDD